MSSANQEKPKRKTHTSTEAKARYNAKAYKQYTISLKRTDDRDVIDAIEAERSKGASAAEAIKRLIRK